MSEAVAIDYAAAVPATCPLCRRRPLSKKKIYGHPVCKKCFYAFANRRQLAYVADAVALVVVNVMCSMGLQNLAQGMRLTPTMVLVLAYAINSILVLLFTMKDGFTGQSLGKRMADVQVLIDTTGTPAGFGASFKRYAFLLIGVIPFGYFVSGLLTLIIAVQVSSGYRLFDRMAGTRVIWKRFADLPIFGGSALQCEQCGYNLEGNTSGTCPECGTAVSPRVQSLLATPPVASMPAS